MVLIPTEAIAVIKILPVLKCLINPIVIIGSTFSFHWAIEYTASWEFKLVNTLKYCFYLNV